MKLIVVQPYLNLKGGAERVILKVAQHYGAKILVLEYNPKATFREFKDLDINIIGKDVPLSGILPYRAAQGLRYGYNFYNLKIKEDYDVLNPHISPSEWIRRKNERVMWYCHTPPREVYDLYRERMKYRSYKDKFVYAAMTRAYKMIASNVAGKIETIAANSSNTASRIRRYFNRSPVVINPGVEYKQFRNNGDEKYFFYPSRLLPNKRQDYVIEAFKIFSKMAGKARRYRLILAGTLSSDPEHAAYYKRLKAMAENSTISILTNVDDNKIKELYSRSTAVLYAPINEDFGLVPLESMSSFKPVVAVNEGGVRETILDGKTGFLVNSPREMAEKMLYLAEHKSDAEAMGKEGRARVEADYSWESFFVKFDRALRSAKNNGKARQL